MRVVLDTNVIVSGLAKPKGSSGQAVLAWRRDRYQLVMSEHLLDEVGHTLIKRYFQERISAADREAAVAILRRQSRRVTPASGVEGVATHPEDDLVLATAVAAKAVLVTGDRQLLRIGTHQGVRTVNVRSFLEELQSKGGEDA